MNSTSKKYFRYILINLHLSSILFGGIFIDTITPNEAAVTSVCQNYLESCFSEIGAEIHCHTAFSSNFFCNSKGPSDLCWTLEDAINCTEAIADWGCGVNKGSFDAWIAGLRGIQKKLCSDDYSLITDFINSKKCWNAGLFLTCTEENVGLTHVADLLSTPLDTDECNSLMVSIALCNAKAEKNQYECRKSAAAVLHATTTFFSASSCMNLITHGMLNDQCASYGYSRAGVAVALTLGIVGVVIFIVTIFLMKRGIITVNRRFRLYDDDDKENIIE